MTTSRSNMAAKDENLPKLGSIPPEEEGEVTRVGSRDEIARALENEGHDVVNGVRPNNLPTPPAPPPDAQMREALGVASSVRLAPPPADLLGERPNDMPTKPPTAGIVSDADVDSAFADTSLEDQELDSALLEPAPASARVVAPPLPAAARSRAPSKGQTNGSDAPAFPQAPALPGAAAAKAKAKGAASVADGPEDDADESRSRPIRSPLESNPTAEVLSVMPKAPPAEPEPEPERALARPEPQAKSNTTTMLLVGVALVVLVVLALLRR